jgi:hypothetical protein
MFRCIQVALTFTLLNTFTYTQEAAEKILIQPWIDCLVPRRFGGVATNSNVTPALTTRLKNIALGIATPTATSRNSTLSIRVWAQI